MRPFLFRSTTTLFLLTAIISMASCRQKAEQPQQTDTLIYHLASEPDTLNLLTSTDAYASRIQGFIYDSLIERDNETLEFKPKMAESWEVSDDKLSYTFHLRKGLTWQDGKPLTVDDIIYTFNKIMDPKVDAPHLRVYYKDIAKVEKIDEDTVRFTYAKPYFKALEFVGGVPILPKHIYEDGKDFNSHPANRKPIGNGPYKFVEWKTGQGILLERNDDYWNKAKIPQIKKILFKVISDNTIAFQALRKGDLDLMSLTPVQWIQKTKDEKFTKRFEKHQYYLPSYRYIGWNLRKPYFADKKVRQALTELINRNAIVEKLEYGLGKVATGPFWIFGYENNPAIKALPYDPENAKKLLEEAGWKDGDGDGIREKDGVKFEFTFLIPSGHDFYESLATIMKEDFAKAGIKVDIRTMEWASFTQHLNSRQFDAVSLAWSSSFDEDPYQIWHSSQADKGSNFVGFKNAEADKIMEDARQVFDKDQRAALYRRFHEIVHEEQPYTFLYSGPALVARDKRFENVKIYKGGFDVLEWTISKGE